MSKTNFKDLNVFQKGIAILVVTNAFLFLGWLTKLLIEAILK